MPKNDMIESLRRLKRYLVKKCKGTKPDTMTVTEVERIGEKPYIWLLGTEDYGNLGDHMIAVALRHFLEKHFSDYQIMEVSARNYYEQREAIIKYMKPEDVIVGTGGGNFGNQYPESEQIRHDFIKAFPDNKIVIMPQTIWFTRDEQGQEELKKAIALYGQHKKLLIAVREQYSYEFAKKHFTNEIVFVPDMVLSENPYRPREIHDKANGSKKKALICLRTDLETVLTKAERKSIVKLLKKEFDCVKAIDTQKDYLISTDNREKELKEFFDELVSADLVVTDRLHGMVFSALAETPCIVFDNYNNKVQGIYEWIKELSYIRYKGVSKDIENDIREFKDLKKDCIFQVSGMDERFTEFAHIIRKM